MGTNRQRFFDNPTTCGTFLRSMMRWYGEYLFAKFDRFVSQNANELIPPGIGYGFVHPGFGRCVIRKILTVFVLPGFGSPNHTGNVRVFVENQIAFLQKLISGLMKKVKSLASYPIVALSD